MATLSRRHIVVFPFMAKGHTIPILHLSRLLLNRGISVTVFTTPANSPYIRHSLADTDVTILELPFPGDAAGLPPGIENTDQLPSMSLFLPFVTSTKLIQPSFEKALHNLPKISCLISDGFLSWTQPPASKLGIPRLVFYGMNTYSGSLCRVLGRYRLLAGIKSDDEPFTIPSFPWIKLTRNDFEPPFNEPEPKGAHFDFVMETAISTSKSQGIIVNSFYELESVFLDYSNREFNPKSWCVGPLCLAAPPRAKPLEKPVWVQWLDSKLAEARSVLYIAFGTQAEISVEQLEEISIGLEKSEVNFLWVVRSKTAWEGMEEFEERVMKRGLVVREWVDQVEILRHESVNGFMSHCGWNSVLESICESVPILAWPMMAEQHLNARMVAEELGVGLRVLASNGSVRGFVKSDGVEKMVRELMEGEKGKEVRKKVKEVGEEARRAMEEGGSSWITLDLLINEVCNA